MHDALAELLGAAEDGIVEYRYADAVRLAGHSCPTVAAAFLMTRTALQALYGEATPERGEIKVAFRESEAEGVTGVMANVAGLITGAGQAGGFKGFGRHFVRRGLMDFGAPVDCEIRFTRTDNRKAVEVSAYTDRVPADPRTFKLLRSCVAGEADKDSLLEFRGLWQDRVRRLLLDFADDPAVISTVYV